MNNAEARFLLGACRAGGADAADPAFADAFRQMENDPGLRVWFERDQAFGAAVAGKLREISPPAGLRESILAGARFGAKTPWWRRASVLAAAAGIAVFLALAPVLWRLAGPVPGKTLPEFALNFASRGYIGLKSRDPDVGKLKAWLAERHAPLPADLPADLAHLRSLGCRTLVFQGKNISLICFEKDREYHLFVARREDFPDVPDSAGPHFQTRPGWAAAAWTDDRNYYVLVSDAGEAAIRQLL
jgi:hypothetical protein